MPKRSKKYQTAVKQLDLDRSYSLSEAAEQLKAVNYTAFDASMDLSVNLGVDPRKANQMVRGTVALPHGTGKDVSVLVLTSPDKQADAEAAGADYVGLDEYITKIQEGWTEVDVIICSPDVMPKVGKLGRVLGPRGLMPNPKSGTVTPNVGQAVRDVKAGQIDFKVDKTGIVNASVGKVSFQPDQLAENARELLQTIYRLKPKELKGNFFNTVHLTTTMGPGLQIDLGSVDGVAKV